MSSAIATPMKRKRSEAIDVFATTNKPINSTTTSKKRKTNDAITESKKPNLVDDNTENEKSKTTIDDIPSEILNDIFELVVVRRSPETGEKLAIYVYSDLRNVARVHLRASRTCKKFQVMVPMFFGLNIFKFWQIKAYTSLVTELSEPEKTKKRSKRGLRVVKSAWTFNSHHGVRREIYLPPASHCEMLKEVVLYIDIPPCVVEGVLCPIQREELIAKNPSWLFAIKQLAEGILPSLDSLAIVIHADGFRQTAGQEAQENRELARVTMKEYLQAQVPKIGAKKVSVNYPDDWTEW